MTLTAFEQDSTYYSILWSPKNLYRKAGIVQEGIFIVRCKNSVVLDSFLLQTKLYDSLGQVTRSENYQVNKLRTRSTYFYSGSKLDSMLQEELWLPAKLMHNYTYDGDDKLLFDVTFSGGKKTVQKRYVYNSRNQLSQLYTQVGNEPEYLSVQYIYRSDQLIQQIDYYSKAEAAENFSFLYNYSKADRTVTRFFQNPSNGQRIVDCIRTYNEERLITTINYPLRKMDWRPPGIHSRDEEIETTIYLANGMIAERQTKVNDQLRFIERHVYF